MTVASIENQKIKHSHYNCQTSQGNKLNKMINKYLRMDMEVDGKNNVPSNLEEKL